MKSLIILIFFVFISNVAHSQEKAVKVRFVEILSSESVVFDKNQKFDPFIVPKDKKQFDPTIFELIKAEKKLEVIVNESSFDHDYKKYNNWSRQYLAYLEGEEKVILIVLLNSSNRRFKRTEMRNWETQIVFGFGEVFEKNTRLFRVNISD